MMDETEDWRNTAEWQAKISRVKQFLLEYTEAGEGFSISYKTLKHHYFSFCRSVGLSDMEYAFSEILHVLNQRSLIFFRNEQSPIVIGIRMKQPVGLPRYYNKGDRKGITAKTRKNVYATLQSSGNKCALCGEPISDDDKVHIDHIKPVRFGGANEPSNLQVVHEKCNLLKG